MGSASKPSAGDRASAGSHSWGEYLLPCLLTAMEACWLSALLIGSASIHLFQLQVPFMPLWTPFVVMVGACVFSLLLERQGMGRVVTLLALGLLGVVLLILLWSSAYTQVAAFFDPRWLLTALNDLLFLDARFYTLLATLALSVYLSWRGIRIARLVLEPGHIFRALRLGLGIILLVIVMRMGTGVAFYQESSLLLFLLLFLILALVAHALARAIDLRRSYINGLQGSVRTQEWTLLTAMACISSCILVIGFVLGGVTSPAALEQILKLLTPLSVAYDWFATALAHIMVVLVTPIVWLLGLLNFHPRWTVTRITTSKEGLGHQQVTTSPDPHVLLVFSVIVKIVFPLVCIGVLLLLIRVAVRQRRRVIVRRDSDLHESLWSWDLFMSQLRALLLAFWRRFFPAPVPSPAANVSLLALDLPPTARDIRAIYRALLTWAAERGHARRKDETPYEFEARLDQALPQVQARVQKVTDAYTAIRYGAVVPSQEEVVSIQRAWTEIQQKQK